MKRLFDCHSHWGTKKGHIFRTEAELARQESIWKTKGRYYSEQEMMDFMRANRVRVILDLAWVRKLPMAEMREYHDYAFDMARKNPDVIFGHWLMFEPQRREESLDEFRRARDAGAGFVGFAVSGQSTGVPGSDPLWYPFYELAIETKTPVMMMVGLTGIGQGVPGGYGIILDNGHPRHVDIAAARYPELQVLAARPAYPWQDEMIAVLLHKGNVSYELHGWGPRQFSDSLKREIGRRLQDRVMFGCDFPVLEYPKVVADWRSLGYSEEVLEKVLFRNAEAYFGAKAP
jgi:predicted TIM-barrel fold metal-dependent hydrolase